MKDTGIAKAFTGTIPSKHTCTYHAENKADSAFVDAAPKVTTQPLSNNPSSANEK
jgi:hypothetical protein